MAYVLQNLSDDPKTLKEAKETDEWPEWEKAVNIELNQLNQMNTWELVDPPDDAIPIANKWVLLRKHNKQGILNIKLDLLQKVVLKDLDLIIQKHFQQLSVWKLSEQFLL